MTLTPFSFAKFPLNSSTRLPLAYLSPAKQSMSIKFYYQSFGTLCPSSKVPPRFWLRSKVYFGVSYGQVMITTTHYSFGGSLVLLGHYCAELKIRCNIFEDSSHLLKTPWLLMGPSWSLWGHLAFYKSPTTTLGECTSKMLDTTWIQI